jgi:Zn ribbon nucleic-acid-binding protein
MGQLVLATCECGFESTVSVGGNRATYLEKSNFPFYCKKNGLISVNYRKGIQCPRCESTDILEYGKEPISRIPTGRDAFPVIQSFNYKAYINGNFCPKCKNMTMQFGASGPTLRFD